MIRDLRVKKTLTSSQTFRSSIWLTEVGQRKRVLSGSFLVSRSGDVR